MNHKWLVYTLIGIMGFLLMGCTSEAKEDHVIYLYTWGDYMDESLLDEFTEKTGYEVVVDYFSTNEDMYVKLKQGGCDYDVVCPSDYMIERMINEDMLLPLDHSVIQMPELLPVLHDLDYDPDNRYSVPYFWGTLGLIYDTSVIHKPITGYADLWDEQYRDLIIMPNNQRDAIAIALKYLGYSMNSTDLEELAEAEAALIEQKHLVYAYLGDEARDMMLAGNAPLGVVYNGDAFLMCDENENFAYVIPQEGTNLWVDAWVVPKNAQHPQAAMELIHFLSQPEIAAANAEYVYGYATPFAEANALQDEMFRDSPIVMPPMELLENAEVYHDPKQMLSTYDRIWTRVLSSR